MHTLVIYFIIQGSPFLVLAAHCLLIHAGTNGQAEENNCV